MNFCDTPAGYRLLLAHPVPWKHVSKYNDDGTSALVDANDKVVVAENQVDGALYDAIWTL